MRDLERASGVGRETIRYYIREGLLPEPQRESRNSAIYSEEHVARLRTIKRLQEERYLPLAVIRTLMKTQDANALQASGAFSQLDRMLAARVDGAADADQCLALQDLAVQLDLEPGFAEGHVATGMISVDQKGQVSARDARLLATLKRLSDVGFGSRNGFYPENLRFLVELMDWVVAQEMRLFMEHLTGHVGETEAADMAMHGIGLINEVMAELHVRGALQALGARRAAVKADIPG